MGFAAVQVLSGATKLSELAIDVSKNWLGYLIKNLGNPVENQDAATYYFVVSLLQSVPQNMTESRAFDTVYQNTAGQPITVAVLVYLEVINPEPETTLVGVASIEAWVGETDTPYPDGVGVGTEELYTDLADLWAGSIGNYRTLVFMVPAGWYYTVISSVSGNGEISLGRWIEWAGS